MKIFQLIYSLILVLLVAGCASENPDLVNPPSQSETIYIRYLNLSNDGQLRKLSLDNLSFSSEVAHSQVTALIHPPADSATIIVLRNAEDKYISPYKFRFINKATYTFISNPTDDTSNIPGKTLKQDLVTYLSTTPGLIKKKNAAFLQVYNAYDDVSKTFDLRLGCQNGTILASNLYYKALSSQFEVLADSIAFTLVDTKNPQVGKMYKEKFVEGNEYAVIIIRDSTIQTEDKQRLLFLNHNDNTANAIRNAIPVDANDQIYNINVCNFSNSIVSGFNMNDIKLNSNIEPMKISNYQKVQTCRSGMLDKYSISFGADTTAKDSLSFSVLKDYKIFVFDSAAKTGNLMVTAKPYNLVESPVGKAVVRVINANYSYSPVTLSLGARNSTNSNNYTSGELLASGLEYGKVSNPVILTPGEFPLTLFTAYQPSILLTNSILNFEANKKYIVVLYQDANGNSNISVIDETAENAIIMPLAQDCFLQVIDAMTGAESINVNVGNSLKDAKIYNSFSLATVVKSGKTTISAAGKSVDIDLKSNERGLVIVTGTSQNPDFVVKTYTAKNATTKKYIRHFLNASDVAELSISLNNDSTKIFTAPLKYSELSEYEVIDQERKASFVFGTSISEKKVKSLYRIDDVYLVFGKTYNIIFCGNAGGGYSAIIFQEY